MNGKQLIKKAKRVLKDHGADIFSVIAVIGVIATGVSAYSAGKKEVYREKHDDEGMRKIINLLIPVSCASGTIASIYAARHFGRLKEESLLSAASALALYSTQQARRGNKDGNELCRPTNITTSDIEDTGTGEILFIEDFTGRQFKSSKENVNHAIKSLQDLFSAANFATLNDFYELLGIHTTSAGDILGWSANMSILDQYIGDDDYDDMVDAITYLPISIKYWEGVGYVLHYIYLPVGGLLPYSDGPYDY